MLQRGDGIIHVDRCITSWQLAVQLSVSNGAGQGLKMTSVICAVTTWLRQQQMSWYTEGMHALVSCWHKAIDIDGDYVEK